MRGVTCVGLDPFLVDMVDKLVDVPVHVHTGPADEVVRANPAVVIVSGDDPSAPLLSRSRVGPRTIAVVEIDRSAMMPDHPGPVLLRPVGSQDLAATLARLLPGPRRDRLRGTLDRLLGRPTATGIFAISRVAATLAGTTLAVTAGDTAPGGALAAILAWTVLRMPVRRLGAGWVAADTLAAVGIMVATGGIHSPFILLSVVAAAEIGFALRTPLDVLVVLAGTAVGVLSRMPELTGGTATLADIAGWAVLIPLGGAIGLLAGRVRVTQGTSSRAQLADLQRTLERLFRQAQGVAGALESSTVADEALATARDELGAVAGALLLGRPPVCSVAGTFGLTGPAPTRFVVDAAASPHGDDDARLPAALRDLLPSGDVVDLPVRADGLELGQLVVVVPAGEASRGVRDRLRALATETAIALENVRLFTRIRELSVDRERQRLARDLHDGVVQMLVHVGFELDLLGRAAPPPLDAEVRELRETVARTVEEVRTTVNDLRSVQLKAGLGPALHRLARDMQPHEGPAILVQADPVEGLSPEMELQLFRMAQEALSNALQHADATRVKVLLTSDDDGVRLEVLDNGVGIPAVVATNGQRGVGLRAMAERARLLDGEFSAAGGADGGTVVSLRLKTQKV